MADLLGIADVQGGCLLELIVRMPAIFLDNLHNLLASDWDLPANGILRGNHILAQTVQDGLIGANGQAAAKGDRSLLDARAMKKIRNSLIC